ncbi:MAG TPA: hypothetical protein VFM25_02385 [Verrucomicrobiae bacterium]|nr:hypothetical protein [Verrucomicrobiae bacterium]
MPSPVACPVCGADGTAAANEIIARNMPPPAAAPVSAAGLIAQPRSPAPDSARQTVASALASVKKNKSETEDEKWKWWYFISAGICIGGYSIYQAYDEHSIKPLGSLFLAVFCIAIGIWDFQRKRMRVGGGGDAA